eukprot:COSAG02_NODE_3377_length_6840_cov_2.129061_2_plen_158_part_00
MPLAHQRRASADALPRRHLRNFSPHGAQARRAVYCAPPVDCCPSSKSPGSVPSPNAGTAATHALQSPHTYTDAHQPPTTCAPLHTPSLMARAPRAPRAPPYPSWLCAAFAALAREPPKEHDPVPHSSLLLLHLLRPSTELLLHLSHGAAVHRYNGAA